MRNRLIGACVAALATLAAMAGLATQARAIPLDPCDRFWAASINPDTLADANFNYPDEYASYWGTSWTDGLPEGAELVLKGRFPHARYMSFNTYNFNQAPASRGPNDSLPDTGIVPDPGSTNPFVPGNPRDSDDRDYTIKIVSGAPPEDPADRPPNTLYTGRDAGLGVTLVYRIYLTDDGASIDGDAGLPTAELHLADGTVISGGSGICSALSVEELGGSQGLLPVTSYARLRTKTLVDGVLSDEPPPPAHPSIETPRWERWFNYLYSVVGQFYEPYPGFSNPLGDRSALSPAATGGPLSNKDATAMIAFGDRSFGDLMVIRGRAPTYPRTYGGDSQAGTGQVRYWSFCQNEFESSAFTDCVFDEDVPIGRKGRYTIVTGDPSDRPRNARAKCGVAWLDWPTVGDGARDYEVGGDPFGIPGTLLPPEKGGRREMGFLAYRQILSSPDYGQALENVAEPGTEAQVMGEYMPTSKYVSTRQFRKRGCSRPHRRDHSAHRAHRAHHGHANGKKGRGRGAQRRHH